MRLRRKSKKEEQRLAAERELTRRAREEPAPEPPLPDGLTPLDFDAECEYQGHKQAADNAARAAELGSIPELDSLYPMVCSEHQWCPAPPFPGAPQPTKGNCPFCTAESQARKNTGREVVKFEEPVVNYTVPHLTPRQQELADRAAAMRNGGCLPGSDMEAFAVDFLDEGREDVIREDHGQHARANIAYESNDGTRVIYRKPSRRRARPTWSQIRAHVRLGLNSETELPDA